MSEDGSHAPAPYTAGQQPAPAPSGARGSAHQPEDLPFTAAFEQATTPMVLFGPDLTRLRANRARLALLGDRSFEELAAHGLDDRIHPDDVPLLRASIERLRAGGDWGPPIELRARHNRGHWLWVRLSASAIRDASGELRFLLNQAEDITEQRRAAERLRLLAEAGLKLSSSLDYEHTLKHIAGLLTPALARWCRIYLKGDGGDLAYAEGAHADPSKDGLLQRMEEQIPFDPERVNGVAWVIRTGRPGYVPIETDERLFRMLPDPHDRELMLSIGFRSWICVPMTVAGRTIGAIAMARGEGEGPYTLDDLAFAGELAHRAAVAVENARLYRAERQTREAAKRLAGRMARLQAVSAALSATLTPAATLETVMLQVMTEMNAHRASVALVTEEGAIDPIAGIGYPPATRSQWQQFAQTAATPAGDAIALGKPMFAGSRAERDAAYPHLAGYDSGNEAFVELPLIVEERILGTLSLGFAEPRSFDAEDRAFMLALAGQFAQALERARLHQQEAAAAAAVEADRLKTELLNTVTHELRTPLTTIKGYATALQSFGGALPAEEQAEFLQEIVAAAVRQEELVSNLLQLAQLESGMLQMERAPVAITAEVEATVTESRNRHPSRTITLEVQAAGLIDGDARRLRQVIANLIDNAAKYSPDGGAIEVGVRPATPDGIAVSVTDHGIGIAPEDVEKVFDRFYRVSNATTSGISGTGLGLAICRRIIEAHGGSISVASRLGAGSTFTVHLPLRPPAGSTAQP